MNTILDNKEFRKSLKRHCMEQHIEKFYTKAMMKRYFRFSNEIIVYLDGDFGDEVFDATYEALEDIGYRDDEIGVKISPYDVLKIEAVYEDKENFEGFRGISVTFKNWCPNFGKDRNSGTVFTDKSLPCPFCGSHTQSWTSQLSKVGGRYYHFVKCSKCSYVSGGVNVNNIKEAIKEHNRVARAAKKEKEANK